MKVQVSFLLVSAILLWIILPFFRNLLIFIVWFYFEQKATDAVKMEPKDSSQKRELDKENSEQQNKRKKDEAPEEAVSLMQLTDVVDDCLEQIFKYLMLPDLISLGDTCKRFQPVATSTFETKCNGKVIELYPYPRRLDPIKLFGNTIKIKNLSECLVAKFPNCKLIFQNSMKTKLLNWR